MGLKYWWIIIIWALLWAALFAWYLLRKPKSKSTGKAVAHTNLLTDIPEYKAALSHYKRLLLLALILIAVSMFCVAILSARPIKTTTIEPAQKGRDIMLCLDVSGSVLRADTALLNRYSQIIQSFEGQRYGLTVFNSSSVMILPLTDDVQYLTAELGVVAEAFAAQNGQKFDELTAGTLANFESGTSLVSDGLVSCMSNLGDNPLNRSQAVILATDNETNGQPIVPIDQAIALAKSRNIRVYTVDPGSQDNTREQDHSKLTELAAATGASSHLLTDQAATADIIESISELEATYAASAPVIAVSDKPAIFVWILMATSGLLLIVLWRMQI